MTIYLDEQDGVTPITHQLLNFVLDLAYGYDLEDQFVAGIEEFCNENDIKYHLEDEDV